MTWRKPRRRLSRKQPRDERLQTVSVPPQFESIFQRAPQHVAAYFADRIENPLLSKILISGERLVLAERGTRF